MEILLTNLRNLVARCWEEAEVATARVVAQKHPRANEEQITFLFAGELGIAVQEASTAGRVEEAFLTDLRKSVPRFESDSTKRVRSLMARVTFHNRQHEGRHSAADLGIVIRRPRVQLVASGTRVAFRPNYSRGLLAQAKLGRPKEATAGLAWGRLTQAQERHIPDRCDYYSLLLYRLCGSKAIDLEPFRWQLCGQHTVTEIKTWLGSGIFPEEISSPEVICGLFAGSVGTEDTTIIGTVIDPGRCERRIDLEIFWPDGAGPPATLELRQVVQEKRKVHASK